MKPKIPNPSNLSNIRQAAEMALEVLEFYHLEHGTPSKKVLDAISVLRQAISYVDAVNISAERVDETAKGEHKPYGYVWTSLRDGMEVRFSRMPPNKFYNPQDIKPVYTAPPKREWVGLTDADKQEAFDETQEASGGFWEFADYLEAKLKEKNS